MLITDRIFDPNILTVFFQKLYFSVKPLSIKRKEAEMKRAFAMFLMLLLIFVPIVSFINSPTVKASETVVIRVVPESMTVKLGQPFSVNATFDDLPYGEYNGVVGCEFNISWNASVLRMISMEEIAFHTVTPQMEWDNIWRLKHVISYDSLLYAYTWKDIQRAENQGYAPLRGNGAWASITFVSLAPGETTLNFSKLNIGSLTTYISGSGVGGTISVTNILVADLNQDKTVGSADAVILSVAFGSVPYDSHWNSDADINDDDIVDIYDALILANNFGRNTL